MFFFMTMMNLMMTMIFLFLNHPLSMGMMLMIQTIIIAILSGMMSFSSWFSYILFLIMVGGMLILFIYMTSMASNEMFNYSNKILILFFMFLLFMLMMIKFMDLSFMNIMIKNSNILQMINEIIVMKNENLISLNKIYNMPNNTLTLLLINYLLLTLIAVVKITNLYQGPLRQKF